MLRWFWGGLFALGLCFVIPGGCQSSSGGIARADAGLPNNKTAAGSSTIEEHHWVDYHLKANPDFSGWEVMVRLPLQQKKLRVCAPAIGNRPGEELLWGGVWSEEKRLEIEWSEEGCFSFPSAVKQVEIRYTVRMRRKSRLDWRASALGPGLGEWGGVFFGETLFLELDEIDEFGENTKSEESTWRFRVTLEGFSTLSSTLSATLNHPEKLEVIGQRDLLRSIFWRHPEVLQRHSQTSSGQNIAVIQEKILGKHLPIEVLEKEVRCLVAQFERWVPGQVKRGRPIVVMLTEARWSPGALEGFSRPGGVFLQIGVKALLNKRERRLLLAHELFHHFNGESLFFAKDEHTSTAWFHEGMTSYIASLALVQTGLLDLEEFAEVSSEHLMGYLESPLVTGKGSASMLDYLRLPYDRGFLISLAMDQWLRDLSGKERSLQELWIKLSYTPGLWERGLQWKTLSSVISDYAGRDFSEFSAPLERRGVLPIGDWLIKSSLSPQIKKRGVLSLRPEGARWKALGQGERLPECSE